MQNMILEALQLTLNNALDGSSALEAEIQNYPELIKVYHEASSLLLNILSNLKLNFCLGCEVVLIYHFNKS